MLTITMCKVKHSNLRWCLLTAACQACQYVMNNFFDHVAAVSKVALLAIMGRLADTVEDSCCLEEVAHCCLHSLMGFLRCGTMLSLTESSVTLKAALHYSHSNADSDSRSSNDDNDDCPLPPAQLAGLLAV